MLRFVAYARVSTGEQHSTDAQHAALIPLAVRLGGTITIAETDVLTGHDGRRSGYQRVLEAARRHEIDGVLVWKVDRLGRDHVEGIRATHELELLGVKVHSATEPTDDPFVRDLLFLLANRETRVLSDRVKMMHQAKSKQGQWQSRPPTGYVIRTDGEGSDTFKTLQPDPLKAPLVRQLFETAATGKHSVRELRDLAHAIGLTSSTGRELTRAHVHKLLTNPAYQGDVVHGRRANGKFEARRNRPKEEWVIVEDAHPAIVDRDTFTRVQAVFAHHKRILGDARKTRWLLTSLIYCGHCGSRMYGAFAGRTNKEGVDNFSYTCSRHQSYGLCEMKQAGGKGVDAIVRTEMQRFVITKDVRTSAEAMVREREDSRAQDADAQRRNLVRQRERLERERREMAEGYVTRGQGVVPHEVYAAIEAEKAQAIAIIDRTLATLEEVRPLNISAELAFLEGVSWEDYDDEAWRRTVVLLIERVTVRRGVRKGEPRVEIQWTPAAETIRVAVASVS